MTVLTLVSSAMCHGGEQKIFSHQSKELMCGMNFSIFIPQHSDSDRLPVLFYLSGLCCTEKNFIEKSGMQYHAAKHRIIVVGPDTSPRNCNIEGEEERWDFGTGAGFYVDATEDKWKKHYRMYSYVTQELPDLINKEFPTNGNMSICGHSMGGHGALICALKNPGLYKSVSAFAPICNPTVAPWGQMCFTGYLGDDKSAWAEYDATCLVKKHTGPSLEIPIDQGTKDEFLAPQLFPENLVAASEGTNVSVNLKYREGYDHGYYFIQTFIGEHMDHHAKHLH